MGMNEIRRMDKVPNAAEAKRYMEEMMSLYKNYQVKTKDTSDEEVSNSPTGFKASESTDTSTQLDTQTTTIQEQTESVQGGKDLVQNDDTTSVSDVQRDIDQRYPSPPAFIPPENTEYMGNKMVEPAQPAIVTKSEEADLTDNEPEGPSKEILPDIGEGFPGALIERSVDICKNPESTCGFWQGHVFAGRQAIPIRDAVVLITRETEQGNVLEYLLTTDESGETKEVALAAPSPTLSLNPEAPPDPPPYSTYTTMVYAEGFYPVESHTAAIFSGIHSIQPITMTPLQESFSSLPNVKLKDGGE